MRGLCNYGVRRRVQVSQKKHSLGNDPARVQGMCHHFLAWRERKDFRAPVSTSVDSETSNSISGVSPLC